MQSDEEAKIQTEKELTELSALKSNAKFSSFLVKDTERLSLLKVALAQRYSKLRRTNRKFYSWYRRR